MLSSLPGLSLDKSKAFVTNYSCPSKLRKIYENKKINNDEKKKFLEDKFFDILTPAQKKPKALQLQNKLSHKLFHIFTSLDSDKVFDEV